MLNNHDVLSGRSLIAGYVVFWLITFFLFRALPWLFALLALLASPAMIGWYMQARIGITVFLLLLLSFTRRGKKWLLITGLLVSYCGILFYLIDEYRFRTVCLRSEQPTPSLHLYVFWRSEWQVPYPNL